MHSIACLTSERGVTCPGSHGTGLENSQSLNAGLLWLPYTSSSPSSSVPGQGGLEGISPALKNFLRGKAMGF